MYFKYDLAAQLPGLFYGTMMRECAPPKCIIYLNGGYLLRRVVWMNPANYYPICFQYVKYITKYYGRNVTIVFEGYSSPSTSTSTLGL